MEMESCVPPGFRFHPTEEELVGYYLKRKINSLKIDLDVIFDIDLYKMEPWDIQARCRLGYEEQNEWYFFSHKDRKYPTGTRTNRATAAGFWKATGRDKAVISKDRIIGMRKTLVFYKGRAPNGRKTDWIMHEYRLQTTEHAPPQEEGWVVCRAFKKPTPNQRQGYEPWNHHQNHHLYFANNITTTTTTLLGSGESQTPERSHSAQQTATVINHQPHETFYQPSPSESNHHFISNNQLLLMNTELPQLNSHDHHQDFNEEQRNQFIDWKNLDDFIISQAKDNTPSFEFPNLPSLQDNSHFLGNCFPHDT